ncbi:hypothetical protein [Nocardioides coralli]|uniref:hypothetical protein n=1 Tax=Nocardioides coralli TaxID=2872154 RepID=UPI001CA3AA20|nr:hypothetical protein [Nocardioides coralli]QZY29964.1 hypothetical protein K6T13_04565 [Nocardioides coralli]
MLRATYDLTEAVPSAHPVQAHPHVEVPLLVVVVGVAVVVLLLATLVRFGPVATGDDPVAWSWQDPVRGRELPGRVLGVTALVAAVVAGRFGSPEELDNLASSLVVGAGWPLLVLGCLVVGRLWRWLDPWDSLARLLTRGERSQPAEHVWPAVGVAVGLLWFLSVYPRPLDPRAVGLVLAGYTVLTLAGCLALGRARWLSSGEPVGLVLSWVGLLPRRRLRQWHPPAGAGVLLAVVTAATLFGVFSRTELWTTIAPDTWPVWSGTVGLLASCGLAAGVVVLSGRVSRSAEQRAAVVRALVPVAAAVVLAVALERNRFFTSVQLLPQLLGDPLGRGWEVLGLSGMTLNPDPLGAAGVVWLQLGLVTAGHVVSAAAAPRPLEGDDRLPVIAVLAVSVVVSVSALALH